MNKHENVPIYGIADLYKSDIFVLDLMYSDMLPEKLIETQQDNTGKPYITDYYMFYYVQTGRFSIIVDTKQINIKGPAIFYILPRQVRCLPSEEKVTGWSLSVKSSLVDKRFSYLLEKEIFISQPIKTSFTTTADLRNCFRLLFNTNNAKAIASLAVQRNLASTCIEIIVNIYLIYSIDRQLSDQKQVEHTNSFFSLLKRGYLKYNRPSDYAINLNLSIGYLNECVKFITGKSVGYWIQDELVSQAQQMLQHTNLPVKEVAYLLGFGSSSYFNRIFFKHAQMTPTDFRHMLLQKGIQTSS